jgi:hypothetical protein
MKKNSHSKKEKNLLQKKRKSKGIEDNFIFRQYLTGKVEGDCEEKANLIKYLFSFDWEDEKIVKSNNHPGKIYTYTIAYGLTASSYQFYVNTLYYPDNFDEILTKSKEIPQIFERIVRSMSQGPIYKKFSFLKSRVKFTDDIREIITQEFQDQVEDESNYKNTIFQTDLESIERTLQNKLDAVSLKNSKLVTEMLLKTLPDPSTRKSQYNQFQVKKDKDAFHNYIRKKHEVYINKLKKRKNLLNFTDELESFQKEDSDSIECLICNDCINDSTDYVEYCSHCGISVHRSCYGIIATTNHAMTDWICESCKNLGLVEAQTLQCILCPIKGGAMKPCAITTDSKFYKNLVLTRENTDLIDKKSKDDSTSSNSILSTCNKSLMEINENSNTSNSSLFCKNAWVHLSCALWNENVSILNFPKKEEIKNIENIPTHLFGTCNVCKLSNHGPVFKCEESYCKVKFHVECARVNHYHLDILNEKSTVKSIFNSSSSMLYIVTLIDRISFYSMARTCII